MNPGPYERRVLLYLTFFLALGLGVVLSPGIARAHAVLASSEPRAGQELGTAPGVVVLEFTEPLNVKLSRATVTDPTGLRFFGKSSGNEEIRVPLFTNAPGVYRVDWTSVSALDGHTVRGFYEFGVRVSPGAGSADKTATTPGRVDLLISVARTLEYTSLLLAVGMLLLRRLARNKPDLEWVRPRLRLALAVALLSGIAVVIGEAFTASSSPSLGALVSYLTTGLPGLARLSRLLLEALALSAAFVQAPIPWLWVAGAIGALAAAGHAAAIRPAWWGIAVDAVHLLAAGFWAGGILALATLRPPDGWRGPAGRALLVLFSPVALTAFLVTVGFGAIQAYLELGTLHALVGSSYGQVLLAKITLVAFMLPLSLVAWRRRGPRPRIEGGLAVLVIAAAAVLAAFPVPPSRLVRAEAARRAAPATSAFPKANELTIGSRAGQVLVGLSLDPGRPGTNTALVYLLPLEGDKAAASLTAELSIDGASIPLMRCGDTCREGVVDVRGDQEIGIHVYGSKGGTATFHIPELPAADGSALLGRMQDRIHGLRTYRLSETLSSGLATIPSLYAFQAPDRLQAGVNGSETIWIGATRYTRDHPRDPWQVQPGGVSIPVPSFIWDYFKPFVDARIVGTDRLDGVATTIVSFFGGKDETPIWFRVWIDPTGLVRRAEMRAPGHFMDDRYYDFNGGVQIVAPKA